jgi:hypothetical protein
LFCLHLGVPVLCRHALLINVKPITAQEKFHSPRANAFLAREQALGWVRDCNATRMHDWTFQYFNTHILNHPVTATCFLLNSGFARLRTRHLDAQSKFAFRLLATFSYIACDVILVVCPLIDIFALDHWTVLE